MNMYNGSPIDIDFEDGPYEGDGETVHKESTNTTTDRTVKTEHWPHNATRKEELNEDQIEVIETAVRYPYTNNVSKLNRLCNYTQNRGNTYAHTTLSEHWPERTTDAFDPDQIQTEEIIQEETENESDELLKMEKTMSTNDSDESTNDRLTIEPVSDDDGTTSTETNDDDDNTGVDWPVNATEREELHSDQVAVIETAVKNPDVTSTGTLTELADLSEDRNPYYAHDVLDAHWEERLDGGERTVDSDEEAIENEVEWPENVKPRAEMNENQVAVIEAAVKHGDEVSNARELTDIADVTGVAKYYGYDVLYRHWPEKLDEIKGDTTRVNHSEQENETEVTGDITELPDSVGDVDDFNEKQLRVFEAVLKNPSVTNASEITRIAGVDDEYDISYGNSLLRKHWPDWREYDSSDVTSEDNVDEDNVDGEDDVSDVQAERVSIGTKREIGESSENSGEKSSVWDTAVIAAITAVVVIVLNKLFERNKGDE